MTEPSAWLFAYDVELHPPVKMRGPERGEPLYTREAIEAEIAAWLREVDVRGLRALARMIECGEYRSKSDAG